SAEFTIGEGELMAHDVPLGCAPDEYDDLISGTCSHLPKNNNHLESVELRYEKITWKHCDGNIIFTDAWNERQTA
ncbi:hypothetical protein M2C84_07715, partial [Klebsiella pneumoniae]|nr:hypothetical protein [Klebsiella pneumoniae]